MKHVSKIGKKSKRVRKLLQKRVDFDKYLPCLWSDWSKRLVYTMPYIDYGSTVAVCVSHWGLLQHSRAVGGSENLGVPLVMWGHNLPPCWDRVNWCDKNWGHPRHPQGQQACIEAARSPLLYRRSWLISLGTPEHNFSGLAKPDDLLYICLKIQQTKILVTCRSFGDLFLFGLAWNYIDQNQYYKGRLKVMAILTCSSITLSLTFKHCFCFVL